MDIITQIENNFKFLSKRHKLIAEYIRKNYDKAAFMNVEQLSHAVGVSEATVVRFSAELGYGKYQHFQQALKDYAKSKLTSVQRMNRAYDLYRDTDILTSVLNADIDKIKTTLALIDRDAFVGAIDKILNAKNIYIIGLRSASSLAGFLGYYLNHMFSNVHVVTSTRPFWTRFMKNVVTRSSALCPKARWVSPYRWHTSNSRVRRSMAQ